ncbi:hypothetical protein D8X55_02515 [Malacoplasma penetrans]|uniref:Uncharacterized protein n=1 Tax=Malacoplasma penetrans (strain HF-2) TaxID=272633 RepID=Q8EWD3_MALP2|nr:hypothetical protein [Malacoplasma penetrans]RXY96756.1 hypothetical protein D8X55_02515 [Malacoplasma penetrans]BAC44063.1 unknown [Malacoplasma penetrans HF-2]
MSKIRKIRKWYFFVPLIYVALSNVSLILAIFSLASIFITSTYNFTLVFLFAGLSVIWLY